MNRVVIFCMILCLSLVANGERIIAETGYDVIEISVGLKIEANFTFSPHLPDKGEEISFFDASYPSDHIYECIWYFDDGNIEKGRNVTYKFFESGNHQVTLMVIFSFNDGLDFIIKNVTKTIKIKKGVSSTGIDLAQPPLIKGRIYPSLNTIKTIEDLYNINIDEFFYALEIEEKNNSYQFVDPNGLFNDIRLLKNDKNSTFILSLQNNTKTFIYWNFKKDEVNEVSYYYNLNYTIKEEPENNTVRVIVNVEKTGWLYLSFQDPFPNDTCYIQTADGRILSEYMIWRENGMIMIFDDPSQEYHIIYQHNFSSFLFDVLITLPTDNVEQGTTLDVLITLLNVGDPGEVNASLTYELYNNDTFIWQKEDDFKVFGHLSFVKTINTEKLEPGGYTFKVTHHYGDNQTATAIGYFNIYESSGIKPMSLPFLVPIILMIILIRLLLIYHDWIVQDMIKTHLKKPAKQKKEIKRNE